MPRAHLSPRMPGLGFSPQLPARRCPSPGLSLSPGAEIPQTPAGRARKHQAQHTPAQQHRRGLSPEPQGCRKLHGSVQASHLLPPSHRASQSPCSTPAARGVPRNHLAEHRMCRHLWQHSSAGSSALLSMVMKATALVQRTGQLFHC